VANFTAISVLGLLAYAGLAVSASSDLALLWAIVAALVCGAVGCFLWQEQESSPLSPLQWTLMLLGSWAFSVVFFVAHVWLHDIPVTEALRLPATLWEHLGFRYAIWLGPGATLLAIGSLVRLALLRAWRAPLT
jgi:hypothetical protein